MKIKIRKMIKSKSRSKSKTRRPSPRAGDPALTLALNHLPNLNLDRNLTPPGG